MKTKTDRKLNKKAFTALLALISGIGLPFTGLAVHLMHSDSLDSSRHFWIVTHEVLGILFTVGTVWHVVLNRKALVRHIRGSAGRIAGASREAVWAAALVGVLLAVAVGHVLVGH